MGSPGDGGMGMEDYKHRADELLAQVNKVSFPSPIHFTHSHQFSFNALISLSQQPKMTMHPLF